MKDRYSFLLVLGTFLAAYYIPWSSPLIRQSGLEAFLMLQEYAREHVLTCLIPALFIAGAIAVFVSRAAVIKYFAAIFLEPLDPIRNAEIRLQVFGVDTRFDTGFRH